MAGRAAAPAGPAEITDDSQGFEGRFFFKPNSDTTFS